MILNDLNCADVPKQTSFSFKDSQAKETAKEAEAEQKKPFNVWDSLKTSSSSVGFHRHGNGKRSTCERSDCMKSQEPDTYGNISMDDVKKYGAVDAPAIFHLDIAKTPMIEFSGFDVYADL